MSLENLKEYFTSRLNGCDALLIDEVTILGPQKYRAKILNVYSNKYSGPDGYKSKYIEFTGTPGVWGNPTLRESEKALVFINYIEKSKNYYEHHWHSHFAIHTINDMEYGVVKWNIENTSFWPESWNNQIQYLNKEKPWESAVPFKYIEEFIMSIVGSKSNK